MNSIKRYERRLRKKYKSNDSVIDANRFFYDLSSGFYDVLEKDETKHGYASFSEGACLQHLIKQGTYNIDETIKGALHSMLLYGKSYVYLEPQYEVVIDDYGVATSHLKEITLGEVRGIFRKTGNQLTLYALNYGGNINVKQINKNELVVFDLAELGYKRNYFKNMERKLKKIDSTGSMLSLSQDEKGYDFLLHNKIEKTYSLKATKSVGWIRGKDGLSDSHYFYRLIVHKKLKIRLLKYIMNKLNCALQELSVTDVGKIMFKYKSIDYDELWDSYVNGKTSVAEMQNALLL